MSCLVFPPVPPMTAHPMKQCRRTATSVMAGAFDRRPPRDVLTSLLNVAADATSEDTDMATPSTSKLAARSSFWGEARDDDARRKGKDRPDIRPLSPHSKSATPVGRSPPLLPALPVASSSSSSFALRPSINVVRSGRAVSRTPSVSPESTPGPSDSSSVSRTSSKRPRTPRDDEDLSTAITRCLAVPPRKVQKTRRKGWKGWVEVDAEELAPSERLINLDQAVVLNERTLRSGKIFHGEPGSVDWEDQVAP